MELLRCPLCGAAVDFHQDGDDCPGGCHLILCSGCQTLFDLSIRADPGNFCESLPELRQSIAAMWNKPRPKEPQ